MIEAARIDGASEWQTLALIVVPIARPVILSGTLISFLIIWKEWFPVMVLLTGSETYTLQLALISLTHQSVI
jgi:multiple sugar transport system permease protein